MKKFLLPVTLLCCVFSAGFLHAAPESGMAPSVLVTDRGCDEQGCTTFELVAQKPLLMEFYSVGMTDDGNIVPDKRQQRIELKENEGCQLTMLVSETLPNFMICADHLCWAPAYSGMDGSLILAGGFAKSEENAAPSRLTTFADFCIR